MRVQVSDIAVVDKYEFIPRRAFRRLSCRLRIAAAAGEQPYTEGSCQQQRA